MNYSLLIEVSTERGLVALFENDRLLYEHHLPFGLNNSTYLLPAIQAGFKTTGLSPEKLSYIAAGVGPGSYTGLRVGAIVAKTMSYASKIPLVGINSLAGFISAKLAPYAAVIDAKIGGMYVLKPGGSPQIVTLEQAHSLLSDVQMIVTPKTLPLKNRLDALYPHNSWHWEENAPNAEKLGQLSWAKFQANEIITNHELELLYLRDAMP